jgi:hypothetical protein
MADGDSSLPAGIPLVISAMTRPGHRPMSDVRHKSSLVSGDAVVVRRGRQLVDEQEMTIE